MPPVQSNQLQGSHHFWKSLQRVSRSWNSLLLRNTEGATLRVPSHLYKASQIIRFTLYHLQQHGRVLFLNRQALFSLTSPKASYPVFRYEVSLVPPLKQVATTSFHHPIESDIINTVKKATVKSMKQNRTEAGVAKSVPRLDNPRFEFLQGQ